MQSSQNLIPHDEGENSSPIPGKDNNAEQLMNQFHEQLEQLLWSEKKLADIIPQLISKATKDELIVVLTDQLQETIEHIGRLASMFRLTNQKTAATQCNEMAALIIEAENIPEGRTNEIDSNVAIIMVLKKIDHHLSTVYCKLREFAEALDLSDCEILILDTLSEKKATSLKLVKVATLQDPQPR